MNILKQTLGGDFQAFIFQLENIWKDWSARLTTSFFITFGFDYTGYYGIEFFFNLLHKLMILDLIVGYWDAKRNGQYDPKVLIIQGICKFPVYWLYIHLVATGNVAVSKIYGKCLPGTEIFVTYLIITEIYSILKHLYFIGFNVPDVLLWFAFGFKKKVERKIKGFFPEGDYTQHDFEFDKKDGGNSNE